MNIKQHIWITWETHRRSGELAKVFGAELVVLTYKGSRLIRYIILSIRTISTLIKKRPRIVFSQNPSIILSFLLCIVKEMFSYYLVIDRHSNFKFHSSGSIRPKWLIFHLISKYTVKKADITIVTNNYLKCYIDSLGGKGYVLEDKLPSLTLGRKIDLEGAQHIVCICTYGDDEPIEEIVNSARLINSDWVVYLTGSFEDYKNKDSLVNDLPSNVRLTGYLEENDYQSLLMSASIVVVLTVEDHTLTCGAYECVSLMKPMVLSDTEAITQYFNLGSIYSKSDRVSIAKAIKEAISEKPRLSQEVKVLNKVLSEDWKYKFNKLEEIISNSLTM